MGVGAWVGLNSNPDEPNWSLRARWASNHKILECDSTHSAHVTKTEFGLQDEQNPAQYWLSEPASGLVIDIKLGSLHTLQFMNFTPNIA